MYVCIMYVCIYVCLPRLLFGVAISCNAFFRTLTYLQTKSLHSFFPTEYTPDSKLRLGMHTEIGKKVAGLAHLTQCQCLRAVVPDSGEARPSWQLIFYGGV